MAKFVPFIAVALVALVLFISEVESEERSCKAILADLTKRQMGGIAKCSKSMKFKNGKDKAAKSNCILRCVMQNEGILTAEGSWSKENLEALIVREKIPESLAPRMLDMFMPCFEEHGGKFDATEEFCKSYDPFIKCAMAKLPQFCAE